MQTLSRRLFPAAWLAAAALLGACSNDDDTTTPDVAAAPTVSVQATSATTARLTITGRSGDASFNIERAAGTTGAAFAQVGAVAASATGAAVTFDDQDLAPNTGYRYRVATVRGSQTSGFSSEQNVTTLQSGRAQVEVTQDITANRTFYADTTYLLKGFIHVLNGATLTVQPGTTIKGDYNTLGSSLFVMRGSKIKAVGTADAPIVFTSSQAVGQRKPGDWGGLIIIGNGVINRTGDIEIEGTGTVTGTTSGTNYRVLYSGGTSNDDDSGELRYVRVEFAGFAPSLNFELNSFTFAAVGSKTKLSYLEALAGLDDSFEFFGGAVDADHLVSYETGDDHFDMSEGFAGRLQYLIALQTTVLTPRDGAGSASSDPQGIENDGCNGTGCTNGFNATPYTLPVVANFTLVGTGNTATSGTSGGNGMMLRRGTGGWYVNGIVARWPRGAVSLRDAETYARAGSVATPDLANADLAIRNVLFVENSSVFQTGGSSTQNTLDLPGNALVSGTSTTTALFSALPAAISTTTTADVFDWTPTAGSSAATGGLAAFSGKLTTRVATPLASGNGSVAGTAYVGAAAPGGTKWWAGWTRYAQN